MVETETASMIDLGTTALYHPRGGGLRWGACLVLSLAVLSALVYGPFSSSPLHQDDLYHLSAYR